MKRILTILIIASLSIMAFTLNVYSWSCSSGGEGSTGCSASAELNIDGTGGKTSCSVTCGAGYYACCNSWENKCQCRKNQPAELQKETR